MVSSICMTEKGWLHTFPPHGSVLAFPSSKTMLPSALVELMRSRFSHSEMCWTLWRKLIPPRLWLRWWILCHSKPLLLDHWFISALQLHHQFQHWSTSQWHTMWKAYQRHQLSLVWISAVVWLCWEGLMANCMCSSSLCDSNWQCDGVIVWWHDDVNVV